MEKTAAKIAEDITIAWLHAHHREGVMVPNKSDVAEFYEHVYETVADCIVPQRVRARLHPRQEGY